MQALIIEDEKHYATTLARLVEREGLQVEITHTGEDGLELVADLRPEVAFVDIGLPGMDGVEVVRQISEREPETVCIIVSGQTSFKAAVAAMRAGAFDFVSKTSRAEEIQFRIRKALELVNLRQEVGYLRGASGEFGEIIGESEVMQRVFEQITEVAAAPLSTVLVLGQTGTGKELVAREIHRRSERSARPLICVNCASIPEQLMESEFMGHERGAFTGADRAKKGLLELADSGTLFLDEIGDLALQLQAKLLRVIEERRFKRVGGVREIQVDVRFIAATNQDLEELAASGEFRADLLYRLNVFQIELPPLAERAQDALLLARAFIDSFNQQLKKRVRGLDPRAEAALLAHPFPGNVRQLRNLIEQAMILAKGELLTLDNFPSLRGQRRPRRQEDKEPQMTRGETPAEQLDEVQHRADALQQQERAILERALEQARGNKTRAAELLGLSRYALQRRLRRLSET